MLDSFPTSPLTEEGNYFQATRKCYFTYHSTLHTEPCVSATAQLFATARSPQLNWIPRILWLCTSAWDQIHT